MATISSLRPQASPDSLPSAFPYVPAFDGESSLDAGKEASQFLSQLQSVLEASDWDGLGDLFLDKAFWKDSFTLTFSKRTIHDRAAIVDKWKKSVPQRKPGKFQLGSLDAIEGAQKAPEFARMAPVFATLSVSFSFETENPRTKCVGMAKLVPEGGKWKIWILRTGVHSLIEHPFGPLPRSAEGCIVPASERGNAAPHGLPSTTEVLDAVVIGGGFNGLSNTIMMEAAGLQVATFDKGMSPGWTWLQRYDCVQVHYDHVVTQLPLFPVPEDLQGFMKRTKLVEYYRCAVEELDLPFFAGVEVAGNEWDDEDQLWHVRVRDVRDGSGAPEKTLKAKNIVMSNGFVLREEDPAIPDCLVDKTPFNGIVEHSATYNNANPYKNKAVVIVGSGNSAHDIAKDLHNSGAASVTMLQRSPSVLFNFDTFFRFLAAEYSGKVPIDTADLSFDGMPSGIMRDGAAQALAGLAAGSEELYAKLEAKGYQINRKPDMTKVMFEQRGRGFYFDHQRVFPLVLEDKVKVMPAEAIGFASDGVRVRNVKTGEESLVPAEGVVMATGYANSDLKSRYKNTGFFDAKTANGMAEMGRTGVDAEGEWLGQLVGSGHPHLYFAGIGMLQQRMVGLRTRNADKE